MCLHPLFMFAILLQLCTIFFDCVESFWVMLSQCSSKALSTLLLARESWARWQQYLRQAVPDHLSKCCHADVAYMVHIWCICDQWHYENLLHTAQRWCTKHYKALQSWQLNMGAWEVTLVVSCCFKLSAFLLKVARIHKNCNTLVYNLKQAIVQWETRWSNEAELKQNM